MEGIKEKQDIEKLKDNRVILKNCDLKWVRSSVTFHGKGNILCFVGDDKEKIDLEESEIIFYGDNNVVVIHSSRFPYKLSVAMGHASTIYIGRNMYMANRLSLAANEKTYIHIGAHPLVAKDCELRTSDMHLIYDITTGRRIARNRSIYVGDHVWLGQRTICTKGTIVGDGSVIGQGSICYGAKTRFANAAYGGNPAKLLRAGVAWSRRGTLGITEDDIDLGTYDTLDLKKLIYDQKKFAEKESAFRKEMERLHGLKGQEGSEARYAFLLGYDSQK